MAHEEHRAGEDRAPDQLLHQLPIALVGQELLGLGRRYPPELVDLAAGREAPSLRLHRPVAHDLRPLARARTFEIPHLAEGTPQTDAETRFLHHLAHRALDLRLARSELPLGNRPVVVARTVDHRDLHRVLSSGRFDTPPQDAAGGADDVVTYPLSHDRDFLRSSCFHAFRHALRTSAADSCCRSMSPPAASAKSFGGSLPTSSLILACATIASWCSP